MPAFDPQPEHDAIVCYLLSKRQGAAMIALLTNKSEEEVESLIRQGELLMAERDNGGAN